MVEDHRKQIFEAISGAGAAMVEDHRKQIFEAISGAGAGALTATFNCPLEIVKTRLHVYGSSLGSRQGIQGGIILGTLRHILRDEGFRGLYRGLSPAIFASLSAWTVYFPLYDHLKSVLESENKMLNEEGHQMRNANSSWRSNILASAGAGAVTNVVSNPLWVVKTRLQTQRLRPARVPYTGTLDALCRIYKEEGLQRGLYSGIIPSLVGISHAAVQFPIYEFLKEQFKEKDPKGENVLYIPFASSVSKVIASFVTYPHEVIRSRLQEQDNSKNAVVRYKGVFDCIKKVHLKDGLLGFYSGFGTNLLRTTPAAVITLSTHELILKKLNQWFQPS